ncbi:hypothetical protein JVU11DRAFT_6149 [Chiua virens]|nr:hypothetical protein JVU11DRAFT_6149 [Chiua virens]
MTEPPRHRSSTLKPTRQPPARLNLPLRPPSPHNQSPQFVTARPPTPSRGKFAPFTARPASPTPTNNAPPNQHHHGGFRAHLAHLLPRHAAFTVTLTIHQLHNVPLVHGEFGLKWKIKGVTSHSGNGILDKVKARKEKGKLNERTRPPEPPTTILKSSESDNASLFDAASVSDAHSVANSSSMHSLSNDHSSGGQTSHVTLIQQVPIPAVVVSANHHPPPPVIRSASGTTSITSMSSTSSTSSASPHLNGLFHNPLGYLSADWSRQGSGQSSVATHDTETPSTPLISDTTHHPQTAAKLGYSPAKGMTSFVKLKEHNVAWEKTLKFIVQMSVGRDNRELGDCLAKFVVMQRVIAGDPDAPRNPRLGVVYLNLAQYVEAGVITRSYLLRQSKTNATLKLSIHLKHAAGEVSYVAPPLPKGEILSWSRWLPPIIGHNLIVTSVSDTSSVVSGSGTSHKSSTHGHGHANEHNKRGTAKKQRRPFEIAKLPTIDDPRGTEKLIEALFNPVPVTQPGKVTPFTYLVDLDEGDGDGEHNSAMADHTTVIHEEEGTRNSIAADGEADDKSLYTDSPDESKTDGLGTDYHSLRSHPSLQGSLRSKRSTRSLASKAGSKLSDDIGETAVSKGVHLLSGVTDRRTWWQKVLSSPAAG